MKESLVRRFPFLVPALAAACLSGGVVRAEEAAPAKSWTNKAELAYVLTMGNSETSTLGFKNVFERVWDKNTLTVKAGAVRIESTKFFRTAVNDPGGIVIVTDEQKETTAENYYLNGKYERKISERFFWYVGAGWDRDRFAGIDSRYIAQAGAGNLWVDKEIRKWKTYYAVTYTDETDVARDPVTFAQLTDSYAGATLGSDYYWKFTDNAEYQNVTDFYYNFDTSDDWRADMMNSVSVALNKRLALKAALLWKYRNQPALEELAITNPAPGGPTVALYELDNLDTVFTTSLVINF
jgi:putative salt-induced outer membrane protein YdiY